jgi:Leucine-rich repeat (LRR) protein
MPFKSSGRRPESKEGRWTPGIKTFGISRKAPTKLEELYLYWNQLTGVKGLEKLTQLKMLHLSGNQLTSVEGLEKLTQLKELDLRRNQLTDLKGLENLTQLKALYLYFNPALTQAQIDELQKALPKCGIYSDAKK